MSPAVLTLVNTSSLTSLMASLSVVFVQASAANADKRQLPAVAQSQQNSETDDADVGAPVAAIDCVDTIDLVGCERVVSLLLG